MNILKSALVAAALCVAVPGIASAQGGCSVPGNANAEVKVVLSKINALRSQRGLAPLRLTSSLNKAAYGHACNMAATGAWGHGASPKSRMRRAGCSAGVTGEAIAKGFRDGGRTFDLWLNSPKHKQIMMLGSARFAGLSLVADGNGGDPHWVLNVSSRC